VREEKKGLHLLAEWIQKGKAKNILVLCGAGVSVSAGKLFSVRLFSISSTAAMVFPHVWIS
jgi:hypothetical protein